jgi:hypothetical protein
MFLFADEIREMKKRYELECEPEKKAAELGQHVVYPADDELFLDVDDGKKGLERVDRSIMILNDAVGRDTIKIVSTSPSKSGIGLHIVLKVDRKIDAWMRVALQAAMGSDPMRELLTSAHLLKGSLEKPTLFFEEEKKMPAVDRNREARYRGYKNYQEMCDALGMSES